MQGVSRHKPIKLNTDKGSKQLGLDEYYYAQNYKSPLLLSGNRKNNKTGNGTDYLSNYQYCDVSEPIGETCPIGTYYSQHTNEIYSFHYNVNGVNFIQRISADGCDIIYHGNCLNFSANPKNAIEQWRCYLKVELTCKNRSGKTLYFCDGINTYAIDVEASVATNSFSTPFFEKCGDPCDYVKLCVPKPCACPQFTYLSNVNNDNLLPNKMADIGFQFMYQWVYYDGRKSDWSDPSTFYFQETGGCFENEGGLSRCGKLRIPVGNAMVAWIRVAYRNDNSNNWYLIEEIEKYQAYNSNQQYWYERSLNSLITGNNYSEIDCSFDYKFCNDKQCVLLPTSDTQRVFNPFPREAQGLFPFGESIALYNYKKGNCPIPKFEKDKFNVLLDCVAANNCTEEFVDVKVRLLIHNELHNRNQFVYRLGGGTDNAPDDTTDMAMFGGLNPTFGGGFEKGSYWNQNFNDKTRNCRVYVEGTDYSAVMTQWKCDPFFAGNFQEWGTIPNMSDTNTRERWRRAARNGEFFYSEATLKVPKGLRGFLRVCGHETTSLQPDTSTQVFGLFDIYKYKGNLDLATEPASFTDSKEIYFDTCNVAGNKLEIATAFLVGDYAADGGGGNASSSYTGYIKDCNGNPVEGAKVTINGSLNIITDCNGFYGGHIYPGTNSDVTFKINVEQNCSSFQDIISTTISSGVRSNVEKDTIISDVTFCNSLYADAVLQLKDCNNQPVKGVKVALSGSKSVVSTGLGEARFKIRNYQNRARSLRVVVMEKGGCFDQDCSGNCNPCSFTATVAAMPCFFHNPATPVVNLGSTIINTQTSARTSAFLKRGGRYGFGFIAKGDCGNISFVNGTKYLDIPKKCDDKEFCRLLYDFRGMQLPLWANCLSIVRTTNLNPFELQWVVDNVEYINGKVRLTIQSLNDYNTNSFDKTNTIYQYLKGDRLEFIKDDTGAYFCQSLNYQVLSPFYTKLTGNSDNEPANFFNQLLIEDDGRIGRTIKKGTVIELQRPKECEEVEVYHTICTNLQVKDGYVVNPYGTFTTFDTYQVTRKIGDFAAMKFEHHSPSDYWGDRVSDIGNGYAINKYEDERRFDRNVTVAATNDLSYFGLIEKTIADDSFGGIVAGTITDDSVMMFICEHDKFVAQKADDLLRVGNDNTVRASVADSVISDAQTDLANRYGCDYEDIGSILFRDGYATWIDSSRHCYVKHNYTVAKDISKGKVSSFFKSKIQTVKLFNSLAQNELDKVRIVTGYNNSDESIMVTFKRLRDGGVVNSQAALTQLNETIVLDPNSEEWLGNVSFTPERYSNLDLFDGNGCEFVCFQNNSAFIHPILGDSVNEFFGIATDTYLGISMNQDPLSIKRGLAIEVQSKLMMYVKEVTTENPNFVSEIPAIRWAKIEDKWNANFLCNINGVGGLYGIDSNVQSDETRGYYINILFVKDNTLNLGYNVFDNAKRIKHNEIDFILVKYITSEQSGFKQ